MISHMKRTTLILGDRRLTELKRIAAERGLTISALVDEFLAEGIRRSRRTKSAVAPLPVFQMGEPTVDLADRDHLWEVMDQK